MNIKTGKHGNSYYKPADLTEELVRKIGATLTAREMADMFCINHNTFLAHYGDAHRSAIIQRTNHRRQQLEDLIDRLGQESSYDHREKEAKTGELLKAIELWMKRYDKLGQTSQVLVETVQSEAPQWVIEPPTFEHRTGLSDSEKAELNGEED